MNTHTIVDALLSKEAERIPGSIHALLEEVASPGARRVVREEQGDDGRLWPEPTVVQGPPFCVNDLRWAEAKTTLLHQCFRILADDARHVMEDAYRSALRDVPVLRDASYVWGAAAALDMGAVEYDEDLRCRVFRYPDALSDQPIPMFVGDGGRARINPAWDAAPFEDIVYVRPGWLVDRRPAGERFGVWGWVSEADRETNPDRSWGFYRGAWRSQLVLDPSKVVRFRAPRQKAGK